MPSSLKGLGQAWLSSSSMALSACCSVSAWQKRLPVLAWLPRYSLQWLKMDFIAGLSVGLTVIPQALAYAEVAGLPPQVSCLTPLPGTSCPHGLTPPSG